VGVLLYDGTTRHWWDLPYRIGQLFQLDRYSTDAFSDYLVWALLCFASFWGNFGWMNIPLDIAWYAGLAGLTVAAILGALRGSRRVWLERKRNPAKYCAVKLCALAVLLALAQSGASMIARQMPPQGRYLFPAMVPIALGFAWGLFEWIPVRYHGVGLSAIVAGLIVLDLASLLGYVLPYFYG